MRFLASSFFFFFFLGGGGGAGAEKGNKKERKKKKKKKATEITGFMSHIVVSEFVVLPVARRRISKAA